ncbi:MAG: hypothetical protein WCF67_18640, partial [Chitinophagaceae bacterium]
MYCRRFIVFLFAVSLAMTGSSQTQLIERLRANIDGSQDAQGKLNATLAFCEAWESYSPDTLRRYAALAKQLANGQKNERASILADYYQAAWLFQANKLDSALNLIDAVIAKYSSSYPYDEMYLKLYGLRGNVLTRTARMNELMAHNLSLLKLTEQQNDTLG